ncbi:CpsD/CapB family tyrosine-protein kinase [Novosphingobium sp. BL-8H]|uniref:CpsD/CapB family tyrosine-protein kinase n=1 Tax=Novosphingobium sp. BL-8H TaxID=3127640 RepID=UPI0037564C12
MKAETGIAQPPATLAPTPAGSSPAPKPAATSAAKAKSRTKSRAKAKAEAIAAAVQVSADDAAALPAPAPAGTPVLPAPWILDPAVLANNRIVGFGSMNEDVHPFFMLRAALLNHAVATHQRVFAVTSAQAGNGKTHVATNLAATLSRIHPTVLIELDLRQPQLGTRLGLAADTPGVDDYLSGEAEWADTAVPIEGFDLTVHRVRRARVNAEPLLASPALAQILRQFRANGNGPICIVDTPPALVSDDLVLIARGIDGVLLVVEEARSRKGDIVEAINALNPTPIVGTILNNSITRPRSQNTYGYHYYRDDAASAPGA